MSIKIHHGPDGTFKTSGAIKNDIIPVIKNGRTLVTNIRGFSREKCIKVLGRKAVHKDFKVIFVDTDLEAGRQKMARFFHWAPNGAYIVIDEIQRVIKPKWNESELKKLSYEGGPEAAEKDDRPEDIHTAFDMQRHYNWDFVMTTTSIKKVHPLICNMAKIAVRHVNMGLWRYYKTIEHDADNTGKAMGNRELERPFQYVPKKVFQLYASTKTGAHTNNEPRTAIYKNPKIVGLVTLLVCFWTYILSKPAPAALGGNSPEVQAGTDDSKSVNSTGEVATESSQTDSDIDSDKLDSEIYGYVDDSRLKFPYGIQNLTLTGVLKIYGDSTKYEYFFEGRRSKALYALNGDDLKTFGYQIQYINDCMVRIRYKYLTKNVYCAPERVRNDKPSTNGNAGAESELAERT